MSDRNHPAPRPPARNAESSPPPPGTEITPAGVAAYLIARGWRPDGRRGASNVWVCGNDNTVDVVRAPAHIEGPDYVRRIDNLLTDLSIVEGRHESDVELDLRIHSLRLADVASPRPEPAGEGDLVVTGHYADTVPLAAVVGTREQAQCWADEWNAARGPFDEPARVEDTVQVVHVAETSVTVTPGEADYLSRVGTDPATAGGAR